MERKKIFAPIKLNGQSFYAFFENKTVTIYSESFINIVQVLNCSEDEVIGIDSSSTKPFLAVLQRSHIMLYQPYYTIYGTIK